jgi:hypothetical protein
MNVSRLLVLTSLWILSPQCLYGQGVDELVKSGNKHFEGKEYEAALEKYDEALKLKKDSIECLFNKGCVQFARADFDKSFELFEQVDLSGASVKLRHRARYNMGCSAFQSARSLFDKDGKSGGKSGADKAVEYLTRSVVNFRRALELSKDDHGALNLEFTLRILKSLRDQIRKKREKEQQQKEKNKRSKELDDLRKQQQKESEKNSKAGKKNSDSARREQGQLSDKTQNELDKLNKASDDQKKQAREALKRAREEQKEAEQALEQGHAKKAAEHQQRAAKELERAARAMAESAQQGQEERPRDKKEAESGGELEELDKEAAKALSQEREARRKRRALLRRMKRAAVKPVERDW